MGLSPHWDICECPDCLNDTNEESKPRRRKGKWIKQRYDEGDSSVGTREEPTKKYDYLVYYSSKLPLSPCKPQGIQPKPKLDVIPSMAMHRPFSNYDADFPPLEKSIVNQTKFVYQIKNPTRVNAEGRPRLVSHAEAILNWQSESAISQNKALKRKPTPSWSEW